MDYRDLLACALLILLGVVCRWPALGSSLWIDELHTSWVVAGGWHEVAARAHQGNQSPLYFGVLRGWVGVWGSSELTLRFPSLLAGLALLPGLYGLVRRWTGQVMPGLLVGLFVAIDSRFIFYATEARPYALVQLVALWHIVSACRRRQTEGPWRRLELILSGALLFHLHYTGSLLWIASAGILMLPTRTGGTGHPGWRERATVLGLDFAAIGLLILPALPHVFSVVERRDAWHSFVPDNPPLISIFTTLHAWYFLAVPLACLWAQYARHAWRQVSNRTRGEGGTGESVRGREVSGGGARLVEQPVSREDREAGNSVPWVLCWWWGPVGAAWLATRWGVAGLFFPRYLVGAAAAPAVLGALLVARLSPHWLRWISGAGALVCALVLDGYVLGLFQGDPRPLRREDWRGLTATLSRLETEGAPLLLLRSGLIEADELASAQLASDQRERLREYCRYVFAGVYRLPSDVDSGSRVRADEDREAEHRHHGARDGLAAEDGERGERGGVDWQIEPLANQAPFAITPDLRRRVADRSRVWLVMRADRRRMGRLASEIVSALAVPGDRHDWRIERRWDFGNVRLLELQRVPVPNGRGIRTRTARLPQGSLDGSHVEFAWWNETRRALGHVD
jgi:mannosyltransferase